jgi:hypothetical protein
MDIESLKQRLIELKFYQAIFALYQWHPIYEDLMIFIETLGLFNKFNVQTVQYCVKKILTGQIQRSLEIEVIGLMYMEGQSVRRIAKYITRSVGHVQEAIQKIKNDPPFFYTVFTEAQRKEQFEFLRAIRTITNIGRIIE